jgi:hypothetical protein
VGKNPKSAAKIDNLHWTIRLQAINRMKKRSIILLILSIISLLVACLTTGILYVRHFFMRAFTEDAVQVIAYEVHNMLHDNPEISDVDINRHIKSLREASVINICLNKENLPVDKYGNPFQVTYRVDQDKVTVRCLSFGPDGKERTRDDILFVYDGS